MTTPKWKIPDLKRQIPFEKAASITLKRRINTAKKSIKQYLRDESPESLHSARIALRRLRYAMEIFYSCSERKKYMKLYRLVEGLNIVSGEVRDHSVVQKLIMTLASDQNEINGELLGRIVVQESALSVALKEQLAAFLKHHALKEFSKQL
jgi:CHAD domain-containing protein